MSDSSGSWHYSTDGSQHGPISSAELKELARRGALGPTDLVWKAGMDNWIPASKVRGLFPEPKEPAPSPAPPPVPKAHHGARPKPTRPFGLLAWTLICWAPLLVITAVTSRSVAASGFAFLLTVVVVLASGIWAALDSRKLRIQEFQTPFSSGPITNGVLVAALWASLFPWYLAERAKIKAGLLAVRPTDQRNNAVKWVEVVRALALSFLFYVLSQAVSAPATAAQPPNPRNSQDSKLQLSPTGRWGADVAQAFSQLHSDSTAIPELIALVARAPDDAECPAKFYAALLMLQGIEAKKGQEYEVASRRLHAVSDASCGLAEAGVRLLDAAAAISNQDNATGASKLAEALTLLKVAGDDPQSTLAEADSVQRCGAGGPGIGCAMICRLYATASFATELDAVVTGAYESMQVMRARGELFAQTEGVLEGLSSRFAALAYTRRANVGQGRLDQTLAGLARSALEMPWTAGQSGWDRAGLLAESVAWARLGEAGFSRSALELAIRGTEQSGEDASELRKIASLKDDEYLSQLSAD